MLPTVECLPAYTEAERSRELRMRSYLMRWYAQRTRAQSVKLRDKVCVTRQYSHRVLGRVVLCIGQAVAQVQCEMSYNPEMFPAQDNSNNPLQSLQS
jgi:hypothetical protein